MAASVGASISLPKTLPFTLGQGPFPIVRCLITTDDATNTSPVWVDYSNRVRAASTSRGRENEQAQFDAGTASVTLDDRDRVLDPTLNSAIGPLNRLWLYEEWSGETRDLFRGYIETWEHSYEQSRTDAVAIITASDEFKIEALDALPTTDPPRGSYAELVSFDSPEGYWRLNEDPAVQIQPPQSVEPAPIPPNPIWQKPPPFKTPKHGKGWT